MQVKKRKMTKDVQRVGSSKPTTKKKKKFNYKSFMKNALKCKQTQQEKIQIQKHKIMSNGCKNKKMDRL